MPFQITPLDPQTFSHLFEMDDATLTKHNARRVRVDECPGYPCRISLEDAPIGEEIILTNFIQKPWPTGKIIS